MVNNFQETSVQDTRYKQITSVQIPNVWVIEKLYLESCLDDLFLVPCILVSGTITCNRVNSISILPNSTLDSQFRFANYLPIYDIMYLL